MPEEFLTFRKFNDEQLAETFCKRLNELNIPFEVEDTKNFFDPSYAFNNPLNRDISIRIAAVNFDIAEKELNAYYQPLLENIDEDYYLLAFTDKELTEIILKPDDWGNFDYQLAQKLLKERGKEIKPEIVEAIRQQRNDDLAVPENSSRFVVVLGYTSALLGGIFGFLVGWHLLYSKKTLPDGQRVYRYRDIERDHGTKILLIASLCIMLWAFIRYLYLV
ncbi:hypothetical protein BH10BAC2_BH10BAC2_26270 [soil metagenome]